MDRIGEAESQSQRSSVSTERSQEEENVNAVVKESPKRIPQEVKDAAVAELKAGGKAEEIAKRVGVTSSALYYWKNHKKKSKKVKAKKKDLPVITPTRNEEAAQNHRHAILFLREGKQRLLKGIKSGAVGDFDNTHLLALLALNTLEGK